MNKYFLGKRFSSEQEFWQYLVSLENHKFDCADGYYWGSAGDAEESYETTKVDYFPDYQTFRKAVSEWPWARTRFIIDIKNGKATRITFCAFIVSADQKKINNVWLREYEERDLNWQPRKFTREEIAQCIGELNELLVIESKKVG